MPLKPYQVRALRFSLTRPYVGLLMDMGLGKTLTCLEAIHTIKKALPPDERLRVLLVAPGRVLETVWPDEIEKWGYDLSFANIGGRVSVTKVLPDADIVGVNSTSIANFLHHPMFRSVKWHLLIVDESSLFKTYSTRRTKALHGALEAFPLRWILTGTFAPNGLVDIWAQVFILDRGAALGKNITRFRSAYCMRTSIYKWEVIPERIPALLAKIAPMILRMSADECLKKPTLITNKIEAVLPPPAMAAYRDMEKNFVLLLKSGETVTSPNTAVAGMRCRQIANGGIYDAERRAEYLHDAKIDALEELVSELNGNPLLLYYEFKHDLDRIVKRFGDVPCLTGHKDPPALIRQFNAGTIPLLAAHPESAGYGLNLQDACYNVCWMTPPWNLAQHDQAVARVWRQGQAHHSVTVHYLIAKNTVDARVYGVLCEKSRTQETIHRALEGKDVF